MADEAGGTVIPSVAEVPEAPAPKLASSASRRVRARLARRMTAQRSANNPVLEPLISVHREIYPKADLALLQRAYDYARRITANGPFAVRKTKESVHRGLLVDMKEAYRIESAIAKEVFSSEDAVEGPKAFAEKRAPRWRNR